MIHRRRAVTKKSLKLKRQLNSPHLSELVWSQFLANDLKVKSTQVMSLVSHYYKG